MAHVTDKSQCIKCGKEKRGITCDGCSEFFCYHHFDNHRQYVKGQVQEIVDKHNTLRAIINEQTNDSQKQSIKLIDKWEEDSIKIIQQIAKMSKQILLQHTIDHSNQVELNLIGLNDQIEQFRETDNFNEIDLSQLSQKLEQLEKELYRPPRISTERSPTSVINKISIVGSSRQYLSSMYINNDTKWSQYGITIAGGNQQGNQLDQLSHPFGIFVDDDGQSIYIADWGNHRIIEWKYSAKHGQVVAGGNEKGSQLDQLSWPLDVIVDKNNDSLIISDRDNNRIMQWPRQNGTNGQTIISGIRSSRIVMDDNGNLYASDTDRNEVKRWKIGDINGTIVAGGNGFGDGLNQLNHPTYIFVDPDHAVYVADRDNNRVMKWIKDAKEGIVVAGGQGQGEKLTQLSSPQGVIVDHFGNVYVVDSGNHRIMRWSKELEEGSIVVGGNGQGEEPNQLHCPQDLSFDREGNLIVVDTWNNRVQKFNIDLN